MIPPEKATSEILRLKILEKYPKTEEGENALIEALEKSSATGYAAERFVSYWIRNNKRCPMPCDVYQGLAKRIEAAPSFALRPRGPWKEPPAPEFLCDQCGDTGWFLILTNKEIFDLPGQYYTAAKKCSHPPQYAGAKAR